MAIAGLKMGLAPFTLGRQDLTKPGGAKTMTQPSTAMKTTAGFGGNIHTDGVDFKIHGEETQCVEVELDPGESVIAEAGTLMYKDEAIEMKTIFGDGSEKSSGIGGALLGAGKRLLTGESLFITSFTNKGEGKKVASFAAPTMGRILPVNLKAMGGAIVCQKDSFLCAAKGVSVGLFFQKKILTAFFGGEGFIMQKLEGDGYAFIHMGGTIVERALGPNEVIQVDTGCLAAMSPDIKMSIQAAGGIKSWLFGGEGLFLTRLEGPPSGKGKVWIQSLPFSRLAARVIAFLPPVRNEGRS
jgi:uncharacterized protein (TIGR00266 family)